MTSYSVGDTVVAQATPAGQGAIGIVRLSGPEAWGIASQLVSGLPAKLNAQHAYVRQAVAPVPGGEQISSRAVLTLWRAGRSYTGEEMAELALHGNPRLLQLAVAAYCELGARLAAPGEFTYRAYLNGKLDLAQAEAVQELISASSTRALALAASNLAGGAGASAKAWDARLVALLAGIEVIHDYGGEDLDASLLDAGVAEDKRIAAEIGALLVEIEQALESARRLDTVRQGLKVALCGPPNVGKSTLFNALLGRARALTSPEPGTTRDYITEELEGEAGLRLTLVDTAGVRSAAGVLEAAGVALAADWADAADVVVWIEAADMPPQAPMREVNAARLLHVITRCDLLAAWPQPLPGVLHVSGLTGRGVEALRRELVQRSCAGLEGSAAAFNARQAQSVCQAAEALRRCLGTLGGGMPLDAVAADLHEARRRLTAVYAQPERETVIEQIFSHFCVGK
jgi:tRNA modification GTPase